LPLARRDGSAGLEDRDLLPDLAAQIACEFFDVVDRIDHDRVRQVLGIECRELAGEREHFAAIIEVAGQLEPAHQAFRRRVGGRSRLQNDARVLGELVHVDDVSKRTEDV
jgi:hypothetical protein